VDFAESGQCRTRSVLEYFGESLEEDCGDCDVCRGEAQPGELPRSPVREPETEELEMVSNLVAAHQASLRAPRQLARFLCGLTSPATSRARLTRNDCFGLFEDIPFADILALAESMNLG